VVAEGADPADFVGVDDTVLAEEAAGPDEAPLAAPVATEPLEAVWPGSVVVAAWVGTALGLDVLQAAPARPKALATIRRRANFTRPF
jgi:hypothetical protein